MRDGGLNVFGENNPSTRIAYAFRCGAGPPQCQCHQYPPQHHSYRYRDTQVRGMNPSITKWKIFLISSDLKMKINQDEQRRREM